MSQLCIWAIKNRSSKFCVHKFVNGPSFHCSLHQLQYQQISPKVSHAIKQPISEIQSSSVYFNKTFLIFHLPLPLDSAQTLLLILAAKLPQLISALKFFHMSIIAPGRHVSVYACLSKSMSVENSIVSFRTRIPQVTLTIQHDWNESIL